MQKNKPLTWSGRGMLPVWMFAVFPLFGLGAAIVTWCEPLHMQECVKGVRAGLSIDDRQPPLMMATMQQARKRGGMP